MWQKRAEMESVSVEDIMNNPNLLGRRSLNEVQEHLQNPPGNWKVERLGRGSKQGEGWVLREYDENGKHTTGRMIRWHPGGGHHGSEAYWRVNGYSNKSRIIPAGSES